MIYSKILLDNIEKEKMGVDYCCPVEDKLVLNELFKEINAYLGTNISYLAEIDAFDLKGAGNIMVRYISKISSESVRGFLIPQIAADKVPDCSQLILQLYQHFKESDEYIAKPGNPAPSHVYVRYDNAFATLKPKKLKKDLVKLVENPRDAFYLPFTTKMLASWKESVLKELFFKYSAKDNITAQEVGLCGSEVSMPALDSIKRELRFIAIDGLKYYPSEETEELLERYSMEEDADIKMLAEKVLLRLRKVR